MQKYSFVSIFIRPLYTQSRNVHVHEIDEIFMWLIDTRFTCIEFDNFIL